SEALRLPPVRVPREDLEDLAARAPGATDRSIESALDRLMRSEPRRGSRHGVPFSPMKRRRGRPGALIRGGAGSGRGAPKEDGRSGRGAKDPAESLAGRSSERRRLYY